MVPRLELESWDMRRHPLPQSTGADIPPRRLIIEASWMTCVTRRRSLDTIQRMDVKTRPGSHEASRLSKLHTVPEPALFRPGQLGALGKNSATSKVGGNMSNCVPFLSLFTDAVCYIAGS